MNKPGRLALVKSVLSAIPVHQLLAYAPPKKTLRQIEKIEHGFLWAGRAAANGGHCHVNWRRICRLISYGGLGVQDLERAGLALRLRWLWFSRTDHERAWNGLDLQFSAEERALFFASTTMTLGNGTTAYFWEDRWINGQSFVRSPRHFTSAYPNTGAKSGPSLKDCKAIAGPGTFMGPWAYTRLASTFKSSWRSSISRSRTPLIS